MNSQWREERILIWGKTYPELSTKYAETVCTAGTLENGDLIRLYPIPYRYLKDGNSFAKYQWIRARICKSGDDPRPESFKVDPESIVIEEKVEPDPYEWFGRKQLVCKNEFFCFDSVESLMSQERLTRTSLGFVRPAAITDVKLDVRPPEEYQSFLKKFEETQERQKQLELYGSLNTSDIKELQFLHKRFKVEWQCNNLDCKGHNMSILDWEVYELARKVGYDRALEHTKDLLMSGKKSIGFFLGNFRLHPTRFSIGAIWYPNKSDLRPMGTLF